jgi:FkbM family methyltransferase
MPIQKLISLKDKLRFALIPKKNYLGYQAKRASRKGEPELELLKFIVPKGRNAIDGGAHKGIYSWYLSPLCESIYAFEPNPVIFAYLRKAVPRNTTCYQAALSDKAGKANFNLPTSKGRFHHTRGSLLNVTGATGRKIVSVEVRVIDQYDFQNIGFIKLDLEGSELDAIRGAQKLIERDRPVLLLEVMGVGGSSKEDLNAHLVGMGYLPLVFKDGRLRYFGMEPGREFTHNCVYLPRENLS